MVIVMMGTQVRAIAPCAKLTGPVKTVMTATIVITAPDVRRSVRTVPNTTWSASQA